MTRIPELLAAGPTLSFEFSAPRDPEGTARLERSLSRLAPLRPAFMSVTYGAGGATRGPTHKWVARIRDEYGELYGIEAMPHLTCVAHTRGEVGAIIDRYAADGIDNLLALRGDLPHGSDELPSGAFRYARELAAFARERADMAIGVAAHPEGHPLAASPTADREHQAAKIAAADFAITQFFFDAAHYERFVEAMSARGVHTPILAGIMPPTNVAGIARMSRLNGTRFPDELRERLEQAGEDPAARRAVGVDVAVKLGEALLAAGAPGLHIYTMNYSAAARQIAEALGWRQARASAEGSRGAGPTPQSACADSPPA